MEKVRYRKTFAGVIAIIAVAFFMSGILSREPAGNSPHTGEDLHSFNGLIAYNALNGTAEEIHTADRQVVAFRNSFQNSGYNTAASKRPVPNWFKWSLENPSISCYSTKYYFLSHNSEFLSGGLLSASERIHLLRILII